MKAVELAESQRGCWRKIPISLMDRVLSANACSRQLERSRTSTAGRCSVGAGSDCAVLVWDVTGNYIGIVFEPRWIKAHSDGIAS